MCNLRPQSEFANETPLILSEKIPNSKTPVFFQSHNKGKRHDTAASSSTENGMHTDISAEEMATALVFRRG